ncbi:MAG: chromate resistance protein ChrB domain-containing protein [Gemmatimonadaceae bacterium]
MPRASRSERPRLVVESTAPSGQAHWYLLVHQIPPKPDYLRVKIGRRLQRAGALALKNSVYAMPLTADALEDLQWIVREIEEGGGDAFIAEASLVSEGLTDEAVRARFDAARNAVYESLRSDALALRSAITRPRTRRRANGDRLATGDVAAGRVREVATLRRRFDAIKAIDFFGASGAIAAGEILAELERTVRRGGAEQGTPRAVSHVDGATWVTRRDVHVDRIASAWLIVRFIDPRPTFRFVEERGYAQRPGELRFDMFEAEYTHVGDACTFETLLNTFVPDDAALRAIAEIVHDVDCKDGKFDRDEGPGLARLISGIVARHVRDEDRFESGMHVFDDLYAAFRD